MGGGNFITQAAPTNFHQFFTRKILTDGDSMENYREVTAAEKARLEASDAAWEEPSEVLIKQWETAMYGRWTSTMVDRQCGGYNPETGYFWAYDHLKDITAAEVRDILSDGRPHAGSMEWRYNITKNRTHLPMRWGASNHQQNPGHMMWGCSLVEAVFPCCQLGPWSTHSNILKYLICYNITSFTGVILDKLEEIKLIGSQPRINLIFSRASNLSRESVRNIISAVQTGDNVIYFYVHRDVYDRIYDEENLEWYGLISLASDKNITFATT